MEAKYAARTLYWLALIVVSAIIASYLRRHCPRLGPALDWGAWTLGIVLVGYGFILNAIAGRTLRLHGHSKPAKRFEQPDRLVRAGLYSCARHPAQEGLILVGVGVSLLAGSLWGLIAAPLAVAGGLWFVVSVEEPEARRMFGEEYFEYEKEVPALSPQLLSPRCIVRGLRALSS